MSKPGLLTLQEDWRRRFNFISVRVQLLATVACVVFMALPPDQQTALLAMFGINPAVLVLVTFLMAVWAQFTVQKGLQPKGEIDAAHDVAGG